jgi:hypothetical protein
MIPPIDPFAQKFDSIEIDRTRAPSQAAIESAMALAAPPEAPGFYLLDDANGRFVVDRDMGVVSLADEMLLESERGAIHGVRLKVVEQSSASYELNMKLRITGRVPQMVGAEEFAAIAGLTDESILVAPRVPVLVTAPEPPPQAIAWTEFSPAQGHLARTARPQPRGGFIAVEPPVTGAIISLDFAGLPASFSAHLPWSL